MQAAVDADGTRLGETEQLVTRWCKPSPNGQIHCSETMIIVSPESAMSQHRPTSREPGGAKKVAL